MHVWGLTALYRLCINAKRYTFRKKASFKPILKYNNEVNLTHLLRLCPPQYWRGSLQHKGPTEGHAPS
ncbi:hypothetical protein C8R48DRAFT_742130, partial [Suillus tomentosus]